MTLHFWVKYRNMPPQKYAVENFEVFWNLIREEMLRKQLFFEWIIYD